MGVDLLFQKQIMMRRVLYTLIPIYLFAFYMYGFRLLFHSVFVFGFAILTEYLMEKPKKKKVSEAVLVTAALFVLSLPPLPYKYWWVSSIGIIFGVLFGKEVFGGFGRNIFNPAIAGRLFIYIAFANIMTQNWMTPGKFGMNADILTTATPLDVLRSGGSNGLLNLFMGNRAGSMGEASIALIIIAAIYLIFSKTASWRIIISTFLSAFLFSAVLNITGIPQAMPFLESIMSGSIIFVTVFMATDPVSAPKNGKSQWIYGIIIGLTTVLVRTFSLFSEGTSFGILIANTFASLLDEITASKKVKS
ncbi:MAG: RnfABCDGE type electron transport complex subunit D [Thermotogae bacterium]|mgnify:CR=1 FL=1|nr:RnfABCDGE type electron transport complex subunit D [Thermotogota bacterium]